MLIPFCVLACKNMFLQLFIFEFLPCLQPRWRRLNLTLWVVWGGFAFSYFATILTITRIFDKDDDGRIDFDYVAIFISSASEFFGTALAITLVDRIGE